MADLGAYITDVWAEVKRVYGVPRPSSHRLIDDSIKEGWARSVPAAELAHIIGETFGLEPVPPR